VIAETAARGRGPCEDAAISAALVIGGVVYGMAAGFFSPAATGLVSQMVSPRRLQQANALMSTPAAASHDHSEWTWLSGGRVIAVW
jgi:MFS family permease